MLSIGYWLPEAFPLLVLAHGVALLSPGPDFFLLTGYAVRYRLRGSAFICLGIAVGNGVYIAVAIAGWSGLRTNTWLFNTIAIIGAVYLLFLGVMLLRSRPRPLDIKVTRADCVSPYRQFILGISSALLNPKNALFYMSLMTVILGSQVTLVQQISSGIWMFLAVLLWDLLVASAISFPPVQQRLSHWVHWIERGAGSILLTMGFWLLVQVIL